MEGGSATYTTQKVEDKIHFSDPEFRRYLTEKFDTNKDGTLSSVELNNITEINVNYSLYRVKSFTGLEYLSNVEKVNLNSFNSRSVNYESTEPYIDMNLLPKLKSVTIIDTDCDNMRFDVGKAQNLESMWCVESDIKKIKFTPNLKLTTFQASGCNFNLEDIKNYNKYKLIQRCSSKIKYKSS